MVYLKVLIDRGGITAWLWLDDRCLPSLLLGLFDSKLKAFRL